MRNLLKKTYFTFFGSFAKLTEVQKEAIPIIMSKENLLIISGTATGKTEAVLAPIIERILQNFEENKLYLLYIVPTRALTKDLYSRVEEQCKELNISIDLKTGDFPKLTKIPNILLTTPESLDSLLCRRSWIFKNLIAVVLDEIHLIDNTPRGNQLLILLKRLSQVVYEQFNIYALSATIASPIELGKKYLKKFKLVEVKNKREIRHFFCENLDELYDVSKKYDFKKLLIFCNTRKKVEELTEEIKKFWNKNYVVSHHGSLSKNLRAEAEDFMKYTHYGVCVSTMTLEIGIDIGNIDAVVLAEVPWSVSSFMQRIGRANRKEKIINVLYLLSDKMEKIMYERIINAVEKEEFEISEDDGDLGFIVQQILSILFTFRQGKKEEYFLSLFSDFINKSQLKLILNELIEKELVKKINNKICATSKLIDLGIKGRIHSNITGQQEYIVINVINKRKIGKINYPIDSPFILGGKIWEFIYLEKNKLYAKQVVSKNFSANFKSAKQISAFYYLLPVELK